MSLGILGQISILLGALTTAYVALLAPLGFKNPSLALVRSLRNGLFASSIFSAIACGILVTALLQSDFTLRYVFQYSSVTMPWYYKAASLWGGQGGSLLFWLSLTALYCALSLRSFWKLELALLPAVALVMAATQLLFYGILIYAEDPFAPLGQSGPVTGRGLNPLLQNELMLIHPPLMYLGLTGFVVPFAWAFATLILRPQSFNWVRRNRVAILVPWLFLAIANVLGSAWAYLELGWGGFWAWDPVENAALIPWLAATPLLHSGMLEERGTGFKRWNHFLVFLSYALAIFGTMLTRSGFVESVHAFAQSSIGYYFMTYLIALTVIWGGTLFYRWNSLTLQTAQRALEPGWLSREVLFQLSNLLFVIAIGIILVGTLMPSLSNYFTGQKITVGPEWFNRMLAPIGVLILLFSALTPVLGWKKTERQFVSRSFMIPLLFASTAIPVLWILEIREPVVLISGFSVALLVVLIIQELSRDARRIRQLTSNDRPLRFLRELLVRSQRKVGALTCHLGLALAFLAFLGAVYQKESIVQLTPNKSAEFAGYRIEFQKLDVVQDIHKTAVRGFLTLFDGPRRVGELVPERHFHAGQEQPTTEADLRTSPLYDLYVIMGGYDVESQLAEFKFTYNPLIQFLWIGGAVLLVGTLILLIPWRRVLSGSS